MRSLPRLAALLAFAALTACGTKTPLTLPPPPQPAASGTAVPAPIASPAAGNKAAEPRQ